MTPNLTQEQKRLVEEMAEKLYHSMDDDMVKCMGVHYSNLAITRKRYWKILAEQMLSVVLKNVSLVARVCPKCAGMFRASCELCNKSGIVAIEADQKGT